MYTNGQNISAGELYDEVMKSEDKRDFREEDSYGKRKNAESYQISGKT